MRTSSNHKTFILFSQLLLSSISFVGVLFAADTQDSVDVNLLDFEVWQRERGYWFGEYTFLNSSGKSDYEATDDSTSGQYDYRRYFGFISLQVKGDELKQRNIFLRPALDIEAKDLDEDGTVSVNELDAFGFSSPFDYAIDLQTKIATPLQSNGDAAELIPFNYSEGTEKTFTADQSASDQSGNLSGLYFGFPTTTTIIGDDTVLYRVGDSSIFQNQLTTLPGNGVRVRTAQGFSFGSSLPSYGSYYRETKFEDDVDEQGVVIMTAREKFLLKLEEYRQLYNVPEVNQIADVEDFFTTGLEPSEEGLKPAEDSIVGAWLLDTGSSEGGDFNQPEAAVVSFMADNTFISNDSAEFVDGDIRGTMKGVWERTGENSIEVTSITLELDPLKPNGYIGSHISSIIFTQDPINDQIDARIETTFYPEGTDPLAFDSTEGSSRGVTIFTGGRRIEVDPTTGESIENQNLTGEIPVGTWFGTAVANDPATAAFETLEFEPSFLDDGNVIYNDVQEEAQFYTAAHGQWTKTGDNTFDAVAIRPNLLGTESVELEGWVKIHFSGVIDPSDSELLTGTLSLTSFDANEDPLDPSLSGESMGTYTVSSLGRLRTFATGQADADLKNDLAVGTWFGRAIPDDPELSPFPEVYMTPTFLGDGNFIANDAIATSLHHTAHGDWVRVDEFTVESTFLFIIGTPDPQMPLGSLFRIQFTGIINPAQPDIMTGKVAPMLFPPGTDPLDLDSTEGVPLVGLTFPELKRIKTPSKSIVGESGDMNADGVVNVFDIEPFILALNNPVEFTETTGVNSKTGDLNGDGQVNVFDIEPFVNALNGSTNDPELAQFQAVTIKSRVDAYPQRPVHYEAWAEEQGLHSKNNAPYADPNGDGLVNLAAYTIGASALGNNEINIGIETKGDSTTLQFSSPHYVTGVHVGTEVSTALKTGAWTPGPRPVLVRSNSTQNYYEVTIPRNGNRQFARLTFGETR